MGTWITRLEAEGSGPRLAVKDCIDVAGVPTTVGSRAHADSIAVVDAECVRIAREQGARIVGKTNLHELCFGTTGVNEWTGTPINPAAPDRVPGGSSSGSAVAVATGEADIAFGTDTGGSVRLPAACCGVVGLKTTFGRIPTRGVWPLAPSLDTVGPIARDVAGVVLGMQLLEPGFAPGRAAVRVGRLRVAGIDPDLEMAVDHVLEDAGVEVVDVSLPGWDAADRANSDLICVEAWESNAALLHDRSELIGEPERSNLLRLEGLDIDHAAARRAQESWRAEVNALFDDVDAIALPTLVGQPVPLDGSWLTNRLVQPWNLSGHPAIAMPIAVPRTDRLGALTRHQPR